MNEAISLLAALDADLVSAGGALIFSVAAIAVFGGAAVRQDLAEPGAPAKLLVDALVRLAGQDTGVVIPLRDSEDEFGEMARALQKVRANFIELLQHQADLQQSNDELHLALDSMTQGLCMYDSKQRLIVCNRRYAEMYSIPKELTRPGTSYRQILESRKPGKVNPDQAVAEIEKFNAVARSFTRELNDGRVVAVSHHPIENGGWFSFHEDITERLRTEAQVAHLAHHDPLTDLPNRAAFNEQLAATLDNAWAHGGTFAVICLDLDRFKEVNDIFGHSIGDALLLEASKRLQAAADGLFLARLGGDEFTILVTEGAQPSTAEAVANRLLVAMATDIHLDNQRLRVGLSVGVAVYPSDGIEVATLLANADAALYRAKAEGRGTIRFFEPDMDMRLRERRSMQHDLESALARGELSLHYQPQARLGGEIIGFEALLRWHHPKRGSVPPATFIPLAEESGLIISIGEWILREACREAASWPQPLRIAINLSPIQFRHGDLAALIHQVLLETGLSPSRLELEITETVLIGDFARALSTLRRIKALGVRIAMDDFGTGYSSLSYLQAFPFDKIKIDRGFIANLDTNPQSAAIIRAVIGLGRGLNLPVVAEGVETEQQLEFLVREFCDEMQGYFIGRPGRIEDYAALTGRNSPSAEVAQAG